MVMRVGGLASGMDIDELVKKLMNAERAPLNKLTQKKTTYEWQRDAYRSVNTKLKTFDKYIADNLVLKSITSKTATSSNSNLVSAVATGKASGSLSIEGVSQLASAARALGNQVSAIGSTKMSDLIGSGAKSIELSAIKADGTMPSEMTKIEITDGMTVDQFVSKINASNSGVNAVFENGRFSLTAKNSGDNKAGDEIQIADGSKAIMESLGFFKDAVGNATTKLQTTEGKNAIFQVNGIATERASNTFSISGYQVTLKDTFNGTKTYADKYTAAQAEKDLAATNLINKGVTLSSATDTYYGVGATDYPNYTSTHNATYVAAFGNTLSLSQQEQYKKLSNSDWKSLTSEEFDLIKAANSTNPAVIKTAIDNDTNLSAEAKMKLKDLTNDKLTTLANLSASDFNAFKEQANYEVFGGSNLKDLSSEAISALKGLTTSEGTELSAIHAEIDSKTAFSDELKATLKSLDKETLVSLKSADTVTLTGYANKASADSLKITYSQLGDKSIAALPTNTTDVDAMTTEQKAAWDALTDEQKTAWTTLDDTKKAAFKNLAQENSKRTAFKQAEAEFTAAETRNHNAESAFNTAKADASEAGILNADGTINETAVNSAPTISPVTMTSTTNVDDMMTKIKEFVNTYNGLIKDLKNQTGESKYRDYAPLTAEQKEDMSENEIKLWEEKAKSGLLRNDALIRTGLADMRSLVYQSNPGIDDPKFNTLYSIGITTSKNYNEGGTLEIDEVKLRKAIEENPDAVEKLFKNSEGKKDDTIQVTDPNTGTVTTKTVDSRGYLEKLRESMKNFEISIDKKAGRSTMTDAEYSIGKSLMDTEKRISTWQDKLKNIEARYWKQFTAMEQAINKANSQSSMFMQG